MVDRFGRVRSPSQHSQVTAEGVYSGVHAFTNKNKNTNGFQKAKGADSEIYAGLRRSHAPRLEEVEDQFLMQRADARTRDMVDVVIPDVVPQLQAEGRRLQNYRNYQQFNEVGLKNSF